MSLEGSILILGAGELGMSVLRNLAARAASRPGITLSVLLRPQTSQTEDLGKQQILAELRFLNIQILRGDLVSGSSDDLASLFEPFETVIGCTGFVAGTSTQMKLARAVLTAGVKRYIPWQFGVDYDFIGRGSAQNLFDEQLDVRDLLRSQHRTEWIIVSTGMFTSFLFESAFGVVNLAHNTVHALGNWKNAVTVTTSEDIGILTAAIFFAEPRVANQIVYTAGDTLTYAQLADTVDAVLERKVQRIGWSVQRLQGELARDPDNAIKKYRVVFAEGRGVAWKIEETFNAQHGIAVLDVEGWIRKNVNQIRSNTSVALAL